MTDAKLITEFLSQCPPMNGGLTEDMHDMLVGARNTLQKQEREIARLNSLEPK